MIRFSFCKTPDISFLFASEIRFCCLLIGIIECVWSALGIISETRSLFTVTLKAYGLGDEWFITMLSTGIILCAGAILPWRSGRHIGLFLSALIWFTMFGVFFSAYALTPVSVMMPILGFFSIGMLYADIKRKPREKLDR